MLFLDGQHDFSDVIRRFHEPMRFAGFGQRKRRVDGRPHAARGEQPPPSRSLLAARAPVQVAVVDSIEPVSAAAFPLSVRRVILDAGHGGSDPGTTASDLAEKTIKNCISNILSKLEVKRRAEAAAYLARHSNRAY